MIVLQIAAALLAAQSSPAAAEAKSAEQQSSDKPICKSDRATGSRVTKRRTCMTAREWQRVQDVTRDDINEYVRKNTSGVTPPS